ncbi:hypothetical protein LTR97_012150 [Elasticomyces elasticus]|uniref:Uncharacterized protein n=1 Tax=Elasticomyces elasticus TaxID=574655 RepID=A0AAN7VL23_9PEZI|nr:hypothetical protein LTR97_012150 [Elasticomyces elasticus]
MEIELPQIKPHPWRWLASRSKWLPLRSGLWKMVRPPHFLYIMSNIELTSGRQVAEDMLASPPGSVKAEHHSSDDPLAVGSDGTEVTNPFSDGEGNGGARLYGMPSSLLRTTRTIELTSGAQVLAVKLYTYHGARRCPVPAGHPPRRAVAFQTSNAGVAAPGAIFAGGRWLPMVVNNQHTTLELTLAVLDKSIQYGEVYGAVFNHFDQTTQTLKPYAVQCI